MTLTHTEEVQSGKGHHKRGAVVITELPYQLSQAGWIAKNLRKNRLNGRAFPSWS